MRRRNCAVAVGMLPLLAALVSCRSSGYIPHDGDYMLGTAVYKYADTTLGVPGFTEPIPAEVLAFNPGFDPLRPQEGDSLYLPSKQEVAMWRKIGDRMWTRLQDYVGDHNGDGQEELIRAYILRRNLGRRDYEEHGNWSFLSIFTRDENGQWLRRKTVLWRGEIFDVEFHPGDDFTLAQVKFRSGGATATGTYSFVVIDKAVAAWSGLRSLSFANGSLGGRNQFTTTGSAGYGLRFELSDDWRTIVFYKMERSPIHVVSRAEYRLERTDSGQVAGYVLVKEERVREY